MATKQLIARLYQNDAVDRVRECAAIGRRAIILQSETGSGKTIIAIIVITNALAKGKSVLFIARGRKLVGQTSERLWEYGIPHTMVMRGEEEPTPAQVIVASKDSLLSWAKRGVFPFPNVDLVIYDEAHECMSEGGQKIIKHYMELGAFVIGLTATPARKDGRGLGDLFQGLVQTIPTSALIQQGFIVPIRVFAPYRPDLKGVETQGGDYVITQLEKRMDRLELTGDAIQHWIDLGEDRPTLTFCTTIRHSLHTCEAFNKRGIKTMHMDADTPDDERKQILNDLCDGTIKMVTSVGVINQGVDLPRVSCEINLRPTRSFVFFRQMVGRIRRPYPGKTDAILLDHAGSVFLHGFPDMDIEWTLKPTVKIQDEIKRLRKEGKVPEPICCPQCYAMFSGSSQCPNCGHVIRKRGRPMHTREGKLIELNGDESLSIRDDIQRYWIKCLKVQGYKGRAAKSACGMFSAKYGKPPWEFGLDYLPERHQWSMAITDLFPHWFKTKVTA